MRVRLHPMADLQGLQSYPARLDGFYGGVLSIQASGSVARDLRLELVR